MGSVKVGTVGVGLTMEVLPVQRVAGMSCAALGRSTQEGPLTASDTRLGVEQ